MYFLQFYKFDGRVLWFILHKIVYHSWYRYYWLSDLKQVIKEFDSYFRCFQFVRKILKRELLQFFELTKTLELLKHWKNIKMNFDRINAFENLATTIEVKRWNFSRAFFTHHFIALSVLLLATFVSRFRYFLALFKT